MGFTIVETLFPLVFLLMFGFALYTLISSAAARAQEKRKNDASPRLSVPASVVTKRAQVGTTHHHNAATNTGGTYYNTKYFATFQFESGDRLELSAGRIRYACRGRPRAALLSGHALSRLCKKVKTNAKTGCGRKCRTHSLRLGFIDKR